MIIRMETKVEMLLVWGFSFLTVFTQSNIIFFLACAASVTTIIRNYPAVVEFFKKLKNK